jgi:diphthine-ammonia ligase
MLKAKAQGYEIAELALFAPVGKVSFQAHPLPAIQEHAEALGVPLRLVRVAAPYRESYVAAFADWLPVDAIVTGDIDLVDGFPNWVRECVSEAGSAARVLTPLWQADRQAILREMLALKVEAVITRIVHEAVPTEWLGKRIDESMVESLVGLSESNGVDPCGENGEYHTMVAWAPGFRFRVEVAGMPQSGSRT